MNNRIKMTDSKFKCNIFLFLSVTVFMARLSINKNIYFFVLKFGHKNKLPHLYRNMVKNMLCRPHSMGSGCENYEFSICNFFFISILALKTFHHHH
jgi:hypothetical protein